MRQIAANAGYDGAVVAGKILESKEFNFGFDAKNEQYVDMFETGILDPTKVTRVALENAASVAGMLLTTEAVVTEIKKMMQQECLQWAAECQE